MIHWKIVDDLYKKAKAYAPDMTDDQHFEMALLAYKEIEYKVLMGDGTGKPVGIFKGTYPQKIQDKQCEK